jgi:predicted CXXCH cytochrome family protein
MCAKCHARRYQIHEDFRPGSPLLDHYEPVSLASGLYEADGQILDEVYEYGSFVQSKMHANRVKCTDCHDPHSLQLKFQGNALCAQCHEPAKYDTPAHHHHKADSTGAQCIECHMPTRMYMVIDERRDHSFRPPRPDLSVLLGTPNACNNCHTRADETFQWAAETVENWYGKRKSDTPSWAAALKAGRASEPAGEKLLLEVLANKATPAIVRATAVDLLANYNSIASKKERRAALRDSDPLVRLSAVRSLPEDTVELLVTELGSRLDDPVRAVRVAAAARLAHLPLDRLTNSQRRAFETAMIEFRSTQELSLDHAGGHLTFAALDRQQGRIEDAIGHLAAAIQLEPYLAGPRSELASLMHEHRGNPEEFRKLREEEAALVERDSKFAPDNAAIFYQLGLLRYTLGQYELAEEALRKACEKAPQNYDYRMALALLYEKMFETSGDEKQLEQAALSVQKLHEMQKEDPRAKQILMRLLETQRAKAAESEKPQSNERTK